MGGVDKEMGIAGSLLQEHGCESMSGEVESRRKEVLKGHEPLKIGAALENICNP